MICPRCGTQLITGSRVCMACGQNVSYISNPSQAPASSAGTFPTAPTAPKLFFHTPGKAREAAAQTPSPASIPFVAPTQTKTTPVTPEASAPVKPVTPVTPVTPVKPVAPVTPAGSVITEFPTAKVEEVNNSKEPEKFVNTIPVAEPEVVNTAPSARSLELDATWSAALETSLETFLIPLIVSAILFSNDMKEFKIPTKSPFHSTSG